MLSFYNRLFYQSCLTVKAVGAGLISGGAGVIAFLLGRPKLLLCMSFADICALLRTHTSIEDVQDAAQTFFKTSLSQADILQAYQQGLDAGLISTGEVPYISTINGIVNSVTTSNSVTTYIVFGITIVVVACAIGYIIYKLTRPPTPENSVSHPNRFLALQTPFSFSLKYLLTIYASWILFVRSFFLIERPWIIPVLILLAHANLYLKILPDYDIISVTHFFLWFGIYCIGIDSLGSMISSYALSNTPNLLDQLLPFLNEKPKNILTDYYRCSGITALIIGKTAMSSTGRAAIVVGVISGGGYLINAHLQRQHDAVENAKNRDATAREAQRNRKAAANEAQKQREFASREAQKQRDWQDNKERQTAYKKSWNFGGKKP